MAILNINLSKASASTGPAVPDGVYTVEVLKAFIGKSKIKKVDQIELHMEVVEPVEMAGGLLRDWLPLSEASEFRRADFFSACGYENEGDEQVQVDTDEISRLDKDGEALNDKGAVLEVRKTTFTDDEGKRRVKMYYNRAGSVVENTPIVDTPKKAKAARRIVR